MEEFIELGIEEIEQPLQRSNATVNLLPDVKKRDLTYDDILESMNLKVINGELQYIRPLVKVAPPQIKQISTVKNSPVKNSPVKNSPVNNSYLNYVPRSKEEHIKMLKENMMKPRISEFKSTKLLFTNHLPEPPTRAAGSTNHFLRFVKVNNRFAIKPR
jgi:hypothetical protein